MSKAGIPEIGMGCTPLPTQAHRCWGLGMRLSPCRHTSPQTCCHAAGGGDAGGLQEAPSAGEKLGSSTHGSPWALQTLCL